MWILGRFCSLAVLCCALGVYKGVLFLVLMDCASLFSSLIRTSSSGSSELKNGFLVFGCFSSAFNLFGLFLVILLGLVSLQFITWQGKGLVHLLYDVRGKPSSFRKGLCSKSDLDEVCGSKLTCRKSGSLKFRENLQLRDVTQNGLCAKDDFDDACDPKVKTVSGRGKSLEESDFGDVDKCEDGRERERERECCIEDEVLDVMLLRKLVKSERQRADIVNAELEKERTAAASAAEEAMAMILRLQSEKSSIGIEANQYRRLAEQKQELDRELVQSLQWIIMKHESIRADLEAKLRICREKLKEFVKSDLLEELDDGSLSFLDSTLLEYSKEDVPIIQTVPVLNSSTDVP